MPISDHVLRLREKIGNDLLFLPGSCSIIVGDDGRVVLQRRSDTGTWHTIGGVIDPGETAADCAVREAKEETGLDIEVTRLSGVYTSPLVVYPNGHRCMYVTTTFRCRVIGGHLHAADEESLEVAWFHPDALPPMRPDTIRRIRDALPERGEAVCG